MCFFLTGLGDRDVILGYPWFAAVQPKIHWARGWIDFTQLLVVLRTEAAAKMKFLPRTVNVPKKLQRPPMHVAFVTFPNRRQTYSSQLAEKATTNLPPSLPDQYNRHTKVFSEHESQRLPGPRLWDHAIELKPDAPATLPGKVYALTQGEQQALEEFIKEHQRKGYIQPSKSPYTAPFFFIKKKDGKLRPVQDYRKINEWTIRNCYPLPLIPELICYDIYLSPHISPISAHYLIIVNSVSCLSSPRTPRPAIAEPLSLLSLNAPTPRPAPVCIPFMVTHFPTDMPGTRVASGTHITISL